MKTIEDFKKRMKAPGATVSTKKYWKNLKGEWVLQQEHPSREVSSIQTNNFALKTLIPNNPKPKDSWLTWPKKSEFKVLDLHTVEITSEGGQFKIVFQFL